ncbi:MAG: helix-turn-helix transcriptional regulator [Propionibacteriaceae bacterium]|jgi:transcriptional regulator with XRE-family HTH domain|nr:helix-turn-helix transcriptional regulator [Propionibacteriaceae bacterium]
MAFGDHLRELRRASGWQSQEAFAHHIGLDRTYVSGLERGRRNPTLDVIVKLADGLGVHPQELLATIATESEQTRRPTASPEEQRFASDR